MSKDTTKKPTLVMANDAQTVERRIRERAYELYEERGKEEGHALDDWLRAEEEILGSTVRAVAA